MRPPVCLMTDEYPPTTGGVGQSVARIARALAGEYTVTVVVVEREVRARPFEAADDGGVEVIRCYPTEDLPDQRSARDTERYQRLARLARRRGFAAYHSFFPMATGMEAGLLAGTRRRPLIASFRGNDFHHSLFSRHLLTVRWVLERADVVTFVNREMAELAGVLDSRVQSRGRVIFNGVAIPEAHARTGVFATPPVIGTTGAFRAKKGIRTLVEGCTALAAGIDFRLLLAGDLAPPERDHWRACLASSGLLDRTEITGFLPHSEVAGCLRRMDVFAYPSLYDGCPNSVLEAAAAGLPILCSRIPALEDLLEDGVSCRMHEPEDPNDFAGQARALLADPAAARRLGAAARLECERRFTLEQEAATWRRIYRDLLH
ncbi:MAG TPA: glycosyltransferase family 4 protein [Urbifossiella sp.]|nr:glycosyltransferase family 4 protein [Urbifossiella sp.]